MSLPSFLSPCPDGTFKAQNANNNYTDSIFTHAKPLGPAHTLWWPPKKSDTPEKIILFIPGNPGLVHFYIPFLNAIYENEGGSNVAILAHSHLGHTANIDTGTKKAEPSHYSLTAQVQSHSEALDALVKEYPLCKEFVLIGHSVGAWICLQVSQARPSCASKAMLLFPTLSHIKDTPNGRRLFWLFSPATRWVIGWLSILAQFLPVAVLSLLYTDWPRSQIDVLHYFIRCPSAIQAVLSMAHDEMKTIRELDPEAFSSVNGHVWLYYAQEDGWVGKQKSEVLKMIGSESTTLVRAVHDELSIPHAFCIHHGEEIGKQCSRWLIES